MVVESVFVDWRVLHGLWATSPRIFRGTSEHRTHRDVAYAFDADRGCYRPLWSGDITEVPKRDGESFIVNRDVESR